MKRLPISARLKLPFLIAGLQSFRYSVWLYFDVGANTAGNSVGPQSVNAGMDYARALVGSEF